MAQKVKQKQSQPVSKKKLEVMNREKGLETSLSSDNKGFAMLQKMGYKPGMGIGKQGRTNCLKLVNAGYLYLLTDRAL